MIKVVSEVHPYTPETGLRFGLGGTIRIVPYGESFAIEADRNGFETLANICMAMLHSGVPEGGFQHVHLDPGAGMSSETSSLVVQWLKSLPT